MTDRPDTFEMLYLAGSYCNSDASTYSGKVLSMRGSQDGLTEAADVKEAAHLLPVSTEFVTVEGMNHAQFGAYGPQKGDMPATISDAQARGQTTAYLLEILAG